MSKGKKRRDGAERDVPRDYEVGYGKPPKNKRFKPGQSGNPSGRPKGARNRPSRVNEDLLADIILQEAYREVSIRDGDRNVTISIAQASLRSMGLKAAKGDHRSQRLLSELVASAELRRRRLKQEWFETAVEYKLGWEKELRMREKHGITELEEPVPHPDHIKINVAEGTAEILGPMTPEEKEQLDQLEKELPTRKAQLELLYDLLETQECPESQRHLKKAIRRGETIIYQTEMVLRKWRGGG